MKTGIAPETYPPLHDPDRYEDFLAVLSITFHGVAGPKEKLFTTDATGLFDQFLAVFPAEVRQHYTCHACRRFVETYGGLVTIDSEGKTTSALWNPERVPELYQPNVAALKATVEKAKVTGVFLSSEKTWGTPVTGVWHHMHVKPAPEHVYTPKPLKNASQAMAEKSEERGMLLRGLSEFPLDIATKAVDLLTLDAFYRSEKFLGVAEWFLNLHKVRALTSHKHRRENLVWRAVASAPAGWCHIRSTMIGTLLSDLSAGLPVGMVKSRFDEKVQPLHYRRPTAAPSDGQIDVAEKLIEEMGCKLSLARRYARIEEVPLLWSPKDRAEETSDGVFGHLRESKAKAWTVEILPGTKRISWEKFVDTVLPTATRITYCVPVLGQFLAVVTALHPDAPPIIRWDRPEKRNPFSWYVYPKGSLAVAWNLTPRAYAEVTGVSLLPHMWNDGEAPGIGKGAIFYLKGARDVRATGGAASGLGLFPEILRSEFHRVAATIEKFSESGKLAGAAEATACGVDIRDWNQVFRVEGGSGLAVEYHIDRWD